MASLYENNTCPVKDMIKGYNHRITVGMKIRASVWWSACEIIFNFDQSSLLRIPVHNIFAMSFQEWNQGHSEVKVNNNWPQMIESENRPGEKIICR